MGITSLSYMGFFAAVILLYYCLPKKAKWPYLLLCSLVYAALAGEMILILYPVFGILIAWICTNRMTAGMDKKRRKCLLWLSLLANLGVLVVLRYLNLGVYTYNAVIGRCVPGAETPAVLHFPAPLGISFYTMSILSYIFDVYYEVGKPEKNYFKLLLFGMYFPVLVSGPIMRYKEMNGKLIEGHGFDYRKFTYGLGRIIIGFFKVLVISERLETAVRPVFENYSDYPGSHVFVAALLFTFRLYTNFSGSMDIIMGISEAMGINLPENFRQPFFSCTIREFWQRWHITLGAWLRDYILYPLLRTDRFMNMQEKLTAKYGRKKAKQRTTYLALIILWCCSGLWHGGAWKYIWGTGILQCIYIIVGEQLEKHGKERRKKQSEDRSTSSKKEEQAEDRLASSKKEEVHKTAAPSFDIGSAVVKLLKQIRTFLLISFGFMFFNAGSLTDGWRMLGRILTGWTAKAHAFGDPGVPGGNIFALLALKDWVILALSMLLLWIMSLINEKQGSKEGVLKHGAEVTVTKQGAKAGAVKQDVRDVIARQNIAVRWIIILAFIFVVILLGNYGPGYDAAEFIYQGF
ncbi:MAG: MBOAT family protein [Lachnospiraceae bacterium]|nr:MBOAT family protein [Lachnospiraceae bacterium]